MTKEDFIILRNSITMLQVAEHYNLKITKRGGALFILCPFHPDVNASLQIYDGFKGFYCRGCGQGGDVTKFVELYEGVTQKEAALILSERFGIPISDNGEVPLESLQKAQKAISEKERELHHQQEIKASLTELSVTIRAYEAIALTAEPFGVAWCYVQDILPRLKGEWEALFGEMKRID
jgi:DNA primase